MMMTNRRSLRYPGGKLEEGDGRRAGWEMTIRPNREMMAAKVEHLIGGDGEGDLRGLAAIREDAVVFVGDDVDRKKKGRKP